MQYLSLFSGIGGFEQGINQAFISLGLAPPQCVGFSEIHEQAIRIYKHHFPNHINYGDITKIEPTSLPNFDFLVGGFPCQSFSVAGKRLGFEDTRGTLFFDIAKILRIKKPKAFLLENVKGLVYHDKGRTLGTIVSVLDDLGYDLQWQVLNSKNFGVPQNRERIFIVGCLRGEPRLQIFPFTEGDSKIGEDNERNQKTAVYFDDSVPKAKSRRGRVMDESGALMATSRGGVAITNSSAREFKWQGKNSPTLVSRDYKEPKIVQINQSTHSNNRLYAVEGLSPSLNTAQGGNRQPKIYNIILRRLTPLECERLQGFPDRWTAWGFAKKGDLVWNGEINVNSVRQRAPRMISAPKDGSYLMVDRSRYFTLGNAVTVNVVEAIVKRIYKE